MLSFFNVHEMIVKSETWVMSSSLLLPISALLHRAEDSALLCLTYVLYEYAARGENSSMFGIHVQVLMRLTEI